MSHDHYRKRLLDAAGVGHGHTPVGQSPWQLKATQWSPAFERHMRDRLLMGRFRYGDMSDPAKGKYKNIESAIKRLQRYLEDGNQELLVDAANLCLIEFVHPNHANPHFTSEDDGEHAEALKP